MWSLFYHHRIKIFLIKKKTWSIVFPFLLKGTCACLFRDWINVLHFSICDTFKRTSDLKNCDNKCCNKKENLRIKITKNVTKTTFEQDYFWHGYFCEYIYLIFFNKSAFFDSFTFFVKSLKHFHQNFWFKLSFVRSTVTVCISINSLALSVSPSICLI